MEHKFKIYSQPLTMGQLFDLIVGNKSDGYFARFGFDKGVALAAIEGGIFDDFDTDALAQIACTLKVEISTSSPCDIEDTMWIGKVNMFDSNGNSIAVTEIGFEADVFGREYSYSEFFTVDANAYGTDLLAEIVEPEDSEYVYECDYESRGLKISDFV